MTHYTFQELIDVAKLQKMMDQFHAATSIPVGIIDLEGNILVATGWQDICCNFHRVHPATLARCRQSDAFIRNNLQTGRYIEYKCSNGLWDLALPLIIAGQHLATLFLGQFFYADENPDQEFFRSQAREFGFDEDRYMASLRSVPVFTREKIKSIMEYYTTFVQFLMETGVVNLKRIETEAALRESEAKYRLLFQKNQAFLNGIPDGLTLLSPDLKILWANSASAEILGIEPEMMIGRHCHEVRHGLTDPCSRCPVITSFSTGEPEYLTIHHPNRSIELRSVPVKDENGKVINVIEIGRDVTYQRNLQQQLQQSQKMEAVGKLAGGIAHDFNNILTAIIGFASLMHMKMEEGNQLRHYAEQIIAAAEKAAGLTQSLLTFSKKQIMAPHPLEVNETIKSVQKLLRRLLSEDIEFVTNLCPEPITVMADRIHFDQVLMIMASNARDAMSNGGSIFIGTEALMIDEEFANIHGYGKPGTYACISISDTGVGMDQQTMEKVFDPFFTTKELGKGTGLGLSTVYGIIKQHDGYINVSSESGHGTMFKIYLPILSMAEHEKVKLASPYPKGGIETVLLVEDAEDVRESNKALLENFGYRVIEAIDGEDAIDKFAIHNDEIDLIILDVIMPKKSGKDVYEAAKKIRADIKILFTSGYTSEIIIQQGIQDENLNFISKPITPRELLKKIREIISS